MEERRGRWLGREVGEPRRDALDEPCPAGVELALVARGAGEGQEAVLREEDEPRVLRRVRLMQPADARVRGESEGPLARGVQAVQRARRVIGRVRRHPCVARAPVHQEQVGTGRLDPRSRRPCGSQHAQPVRLRLEATVAARVELRDEGGAPVDLHAEHLAGASGSEVRSAEAPRREGGLEGGSGPIAHAGPRPWRTRSSRTREPSSTRSMTSSKPSGPP